MNVLLGAIMNNKKSLLEYREEDLKIYIDDMLQRAQDVKSCSDNNYIDIHTRILELEKAVRRLTITSYQIKALVSDKDGTLGLDYEH